jgi:hypothetical protein
MSNPTAGLQDMTAGQTVPGGSQNVNPLGGSVFSNLASTSPTVATLPGQTSAAGSYPTLNIGTPTGLTGAGSTVPASTGGFNPAAGVSNLSTPTTSTGSYTLMGDLQATYGQGTGTAIGNILGSLGTTTSQALQTMDKATIDAAQQEYGNLLSSEAARGVSADSSTAALMASQFGSNVTDAISANAANIGLNEEATLLNTLTGLGAAHGGDVSGWGEFGNIMQGIGGAATSILSGGASSVGGKLLGNIAPSLFG